MKNRMVVLLLSVVALAGCSSGTGESDSGTFSDIAEVQSSIDAPGTTEDLVADTEAPGDGSTPDVTAPHPCTEEGAIPGPCELTYDFGDGFGNRFVDTWEEGLLQRRDRYDLADSLEGYALFFYDGTESIQKAESYEAPDNLISESTYEYDGDLLVSISTESLVSGEVTVEVWVYDEAGNVIAEGDDTDNDGLPNGGMTYEYDDQGNMTDYTFNGSDDDEVDMVAHFEYDDQGQMTTGTWEMAGFGAGTYEAEYDDAGREVVRRMLTEAGSLFILTESEYDIVGNLIRQVESTYTSGGDEPDGVLDATWDYSCWPCFDE